MAKMSFVSTVTVFVGCFVLGIQAQATNKLNCNDVPYRTLSELNEVTYRKKLDNAVYLSYPQIEAMQLYLCNTVARPAIWLLLLNSKLDTLYHAVAHVVGVPPNYPTNEENSKFPWDRFEYTLTRSLGSIESRFGEIYLSVATNQSNRNVQLKNRDQIIDYNCRTLETSFGPFYRDLMLLERLSKNDQLIRNIAEYDEKLHRLIVVYRTCQMMQARTSEH